MMQLFTNTGEHINKIFVNEDIGIEQKTRPIMGLFFPMITACFIRNDDIFVSMFHRETSL